MLVAVVASTIASTVPVRTIIMGIMCLISVSVYCTNMRHILRAYIPYWLLAVSRRALHRTDDIRGWSIKSDYGTRRRIIEWRIRLWRRGAQNCKMTFVPPRNTCPSKTTCPVWARGRCRISPPRFLAECCKRQLNQVSLVLLYFRLSAFSDLCWVCLSVFSCTVLFVSISQVIGCDDRLRNDLYCVGWGVKLYSNQNQIENNHRRHPSKLRPKGWMKMYDLQITD